MLTDNSLKASPRLAELFLPKGIIIGLKSCTKQAVIVELVHHLVGLGCLKEEHAETVTQSILAKEKRGTSALYGGIAFPHCRCNITDKFVGVLGIEPRGIPFDAVGGEPVRSIFLFLAPLDRRQELYEILGRMLAIGKDKGRRLQLQGCRTAEAVHHFLKELDNQ